MAEKDTDWTKYLIVGGVIGGTALGVYGIYKIAQWAGEREKMKQELIQEYISELREVQAFQRELIEKGAVTDLERELLKSMQDALDWKQQTLITYDTSWAADLAHSVEDFTKTFGLYILIPVASIMFVSLAGKVINEIFKHWPISKRITPPPAGTDPIEPIPAVPPPPYVCPSCGWEFEFPDQMLDHIKDYHGISRNPIDIRQAQAYLEQTSPYTQSLIVAESGLGRTFYTDWTTIGIIALITIALAIAIVLSVGTATPGVIVAPYSVVAEAEQVLAAACARAILVPVAVP